MHPKYRNVSFLFRSVILAIVGIAAVAFCVACSDVGVDDLGTRSPNRVETTTQSTSEMASEAVLQERISDFRSALWSDQLSPQDNSVVFNVSRSNPSSPEIRFVLVALSGTGDFFGRDCDSHSGPTSTPQGGLESSVTTTFTNNAAHPMFDTTALCGIERNVGGHHTDLGDIGPGETATWDWNVVITSRWVGKANCLMVWKVVQP